MRILGGEVLMRHPTSGLPVTFTGSMNFDNVMIKGAGQSKFAIEEEDSRWGMVWNNAKDNTAEFPQFVKNSVFYKSSGPAVGVKGVNDIEITGNTFHRNAHGGVRFYKGTGSKVNKNLAIDTLHYAAWEQFFLGDSGKDFSTFNGALAEKVWPAAFQMGPVGDGSANEFKNNRVASSGVIGIRHEGHSCEQDVAAYENMSGNTVRGAMIGFLLRGEGKNSCAIADGLDVSMSTFAGIYIMAEEGASLTVQNSKVANSAQNGFVHMNGGPGSTGTGHFHKHGNAMFKNSLVIGMDDEFDCETEKYSSDGPSMVNSLAKEYFPGFKYEFSAIRWGFSTEKKHDIPHKPASWTSIMGFPTVRGQGTYSGVTIKKVGNTCDEWKEAVVVGFEPVGHNSQPLMVFEKIVKEDITGKLIHYPVPSTGAINPGTCIDMECDDTTTQLLIDLDGSLTGSGGKGAIMPIREFGWDDDNEKPRGLGDYRIPKTALTTMQGDRIATETSMPNKGRPRTSTCTKEESLNAWVCSGEESYEYMQLIVENMDIDSQHRRCAPLALITNRGENGNVDLYNGPAREGWGERLGLWHTTVAAGTETEMFFTGSPPKRTRLQVTGGANAGGKVLLKFYNPLPQKLQVEKLDLKKVATIIPSNDLDEQGEMISCQGTPETCGFLPTLESDGGAHYQWRDEQMLYLVLDDGDYAYDITVTDQVLMSFGFPPVAIADFFEAEIITNLANFFGIDPSAIRVVDVIREDTDLSGNRKRRSSDAGVTGVEIEVTPDSDTKESVASKTSEIVDSVSLGDTSVMASIMENTGVDAKAIEITSFTPMPPSEDADDNSKFDAWVASITSIIEEGKAQISQAIPSVGSIELSWEGFNGGVTTFDERTSFSMQPVIRFKDSDGTYLTSVGNPADPWIVQATLVNGASSQTLGGQTSRQVVAGQSEFIDLNVNLADEANLDRDLQIQFAVVSPAAAVNRFNQTSLSFKISGRTVGAVISAGETDEDIIVGDYIDYAVNLVDGNGELLQDSAWKGYTWIVWEEQTNTKATFPASGDAEVSISIPTSAVTPNTFFAGNFAIVAYQSNDTASAAIMQMFTAENVSPLLVKHDPVDIAAALPVSKHFEIRYPNMDLAEFVATSLTSWFHAKIAGSGDLSTYVITDLELTSGSIILTGTVHAATEAKLLTAFEEVEQELLKNPTYGGVAFEFSNNACMMKTADVREMVSAGACRGESTGVPGNGSGVDVDPVDGEITTALEGWAIALIAISAIIATLFVVFLIMVCVGRKNGGSHRLMTDGY